MGWGGVEVRTQRGWEMGSCSHLREFGFRPKMGLGLGVGPSLSETQIGWVEDPRRLGDGFFRVQIQKGLGCVRSLDPRGCGFRFGSFPVWTPNKMGWGRSPNLRGLRVGSMSGPKGVWVLPCSNAIWVGVGVLTQKSLGPSLPYLKRIGMRLGFKPKMVGAGSMSEPKGFWVLVLPSPNPKGSGLVLVSGPNRVGVWGIVSDLKRGLDPSMFGPKRVGGWVYVRTQRGLGLFVFEPKMDLGVGPSLFTPIVGMDIGLGLGSSVFGLNMVGVGVLPCPNPKWFNVQT
ncbi:hypothetical protein POTOM_011487 [Populus tomentosa]|uniref:Uncharacterized protein n=1 Tax=Populus tomentosa TaxID=118781 RepID=A0A8X8A5M6_POPTO|nr:hypothetical protein POTOM_011487 [Populus tomentosa]